MKHIFVLVIILVSPHLFASAKVAFNNELPENPNKSFSAQWGLDALDIPKYLTDNSAESLGLILPEQSVLNHHISFTQQDSNWLKSNNENSIYRLSSVTKSSTNTNTSGLNLAYSNGRFSAETGVISNSNNLLSSGKIYLQGAYSLYDTQRFNVSLTAKVEALDENNVQSYFGSDVLSNNVSVFEELHATNTTLGIVSTYSINKRWKVLGMLSSTTLDNKIESSPLIEDNNLHMALIGTSYAF